MQSRRDTFLCASLLATALALAACADAPDAPSALGTASSSAASSAPALERRSGDESRNRPGAVYTLTNAAGGNGVVAFHRAENGVWLTGAVPPQFLSDADALRSTVPLPPWPL